MSPEKTLDALDSYIKMLESQLAEAVQILKERPSYADQIMSKKRKVLWGVRVKNFLKSYRETRGPALEQPIVATTNPNLNFHHDTN